MLRAPLQSLALSRVMPRARRTFAWVNEGLRVVACHAPQVQGPEKSLHSALDTQVLQEIQSRDPSSIPPLNALFDQYSTNARSVLDTTLSYEPNPRINRRISFDSHHPGIVLLAHAALVGLEYRITFCSGFAIETCHNLNVIVSCAHTLDQICHSQLLLKSNGRSAALIFIRRDGDLEVTAEPVLGVLASLPRSDLVVFSTGQSCMKTLPICPYPALAGARVRAHFVSETRPTVDAGWSPWVHGTWSKWVQGEVVGYRDLAGRETVPGTYDSLSHLMFNPPPSAGSSGGPIVDEETGAVVGVVLGSRMDSQVEGTRGWGVPSEAIYEMFRLPGSAHVT